MAQNSKKDDLTIKGGDKPGVWGRKGPILLGFVALGLVLRFFPLFSKPIIVEFIDGDAAIVENGKNRVLGENSKIHPGERIEVKRGATVRLRLPGGRTMNVVDEGSLELRSSRGVWGGSKIKYELFLEKGRISVSGHASKGVDGSITTPFGVAGIRGTVFTLGADRSMTLSLYQGKVVAGGLSGDTIEVRPGKGMVIRSGGPLRAVELLEGPAILKPGPGDRLDHTGKIRLSRVAGAVFYRIEVAEDENFTRIMGTQTGDEVLGVPALPFDGPAYVRAVAISGDGLEGKPSKAVHFHSKAHYSTGLSLQKAKRYQEAIDSFERAGKGYSDDTRVLKDLAWTLYLAGDWSGAKPIYERVLKLDPTDLEARIEAGRTLFWLQEYAESERLYREVIKKTPKDSDAHWGLSDVLRVMGRKNEALVSVQTALRMNPGHPYAMKTLLELKKGKDGE